MHQAVDEVLAGRVRLDGARSTWPSVLASGLLHGALALGVVIAPMLAARHRELPRYVAVTVVPVRSLGVENPAPAESTPPSEVTRPTPARLEAEVESPPAMTMPTPQVGPHTPPAAAREKPPSPRPRETSPVRERPQAAEAQGPSGIPGARLGAPEGLPEGTSPFGAAVAGIDNPDFTYGYYVDQMLAMIRSRWLRPPLGDDTEAMIHFRIHSDGSVSEVRIVSSSGYNQFDLAGLRAIQSAAPFPPLPRSYRRDSLGVNLIFR